MLIQTLKGNLAHGVAYLLIGGAAFGFEYWMLKQSSSLHPEATATQQCINTQSGQALEVKLASSSEKDAGSADHNEIISLKKSLLEEQQKNQKLIALINEKSKNDNSSKESNLSNITEQVDSEIQQGIYSVDPATRDKSIRALSQLGSEWSKDFLLQIINDEKEDASLKRDIIYATDWHGSLSDAVKIFNQNENEVIKSSVIMAIRQSSLDDFEKQTIDDFFHQIIFQNEDDFVKTCILDYFAEKNRSQLSKIKNELSGSEAISLSESLTKHLSDILGES